MAAKDQPIVIKKVVKGGGGGHHGGAWKVAYADFVTAMMAFFLLLWILGATTEKQRKGIADYFTPTLVKNKELSAGSGAGLLGGSSLTDADDYPHRAGQTGTKTLTIPRDATGGAKEGGSKVKRTMRAKSSTSMGCSASCGHARTSLRSSSSSIFGKDLATGGLKLRHCRSTWR